MTAAAPAPPATADEIRRRLLSATSIFADPSRQQRYVSDSWTRMQIVLRLLDALRGEGVGRVLELGANPYFMTLQMLWRFEFDLELANYFGESHTAPTGVHRVEVDGAAHDFAYRHFNVEIDPFPYADGAFDCVLFCEILEHLLVNPDHALREIARIVRPGGFVIVTTPNATRLPNLYFLAKGQSIWEGYSPNGPYGRHNREFTLAEVQQLLERTGFGVWRAEVQNVQHLARRFTWLQWMRPTVWNEHLFVVGRRS